MICTFCKYYVWCQTINATQDPDGANVNGSTGRLASHSVLVAIVCRIGVHNSFCSGHSPSLPVSSWHLPIKSLCDDLAAFSVLDDWCKIVAMSAGCDHGQFHDLRDVSEARSDAVWTEENAKMTTRNHPNDLLWTKYAHTYIPYHSGYWLNTMFSKCRHRISRSVFQEARWEIGHAKWGDLRKECRQRIAKALAGLESFARHCGTKKRMS